MIVISLSTIPSRFEHLSFTLNSLLNQSLPADLIEVYIPHKYKRFPEWDGALPALPSGVQLIRCPIDFGPATKILPALERHKNKNTDIIYCDDDREYHHDWIKAFAYARKKKPHDAIANYGWNITKKSFFERPIPIKTIFDLTYRAKRIKQTLDQLLTKKKITKPQRSWRYLKGGYVDIMEGYGGCMITPLMFDSTTFDIPNEIWAVDDIWLSGMLAKNGYKIWLNPHGKVIDSQHHHVNDALTQAVINGHGRDELNNNAILFLKKKYQIWK